MLSKKKCIINYKSEIFSFRKKYFILSIINSIIEKKKNPIEIIHLKYKYIYKISFSLFIASLDLVEIELLRI